MQKKVNIILGLLIILLVIGIYNIIPRDKNLGDRTSSNGSAIGINVTEVDSATTSPTYFTVGTTASSTLILDTEYASNLALDVCLTSSSTPSAMTLMWNIEYANTYFVDELDWFSYVDYAETSSILRTWGGDVVLNKLTPTEASASSTCVHIDDADELLGVKTKITYNITGAKGAVYLKASTK